MESKNNTLVVQENELQENKQNLQNNSHNQGPELIFLDSDDDEYCEKNNFQELFDGSPNGDSEKQEANQDSAEAEKYDGKGSFHFDYHDNRGTEINLKGCLTTDLDDIKYTVDGNLNINLNRLIGKTADDKVKINVSMRSSEKNFFDLKRGENDEVSCKFALTNIGEKSLINKIIDEITDDIKNNDLKSMIQNFQLKFAQELEKGMRQQMSGGKN